VPYPLPPSALAGKCSVHRLALSVRREPLGPDSSGGCQEK
jgi:hypothetical protein